MGIPHRPKPERTLPKNPNRLTLKQHVFPAHSIERFADRNGRVSVCDMLRHQVRLAAPDDSLFCARRAWDERAESGFMKRIEDRFQEIARLIIDGQATTVTPEQKRAIERMFALWYMRTRFRDLDAQEIQLAGITGDELTKMQEEHLEKNRYAFVRKGGRMPARQINGLQLQRRIDGYADELAAVTRWGIISAQSGEFIVPDVPSHTILPLSPRLALIGSAPDGIILEQNLAEINRSVRASSQAYFFARDLSNCPI
jgi:hypothetical protein